MVWKVLSQSLTIILAAGIRDRNDSFSYTPLYQHLSSNVVDEYSVDTGDRLEMKK